MFVQDTIAVPQEDAQVLTTVDLLVSSWITPQKAPLPSTEYIGFLDPSLQYDFPDLCLSHDAHVFCDGIKQCRLVSGFLGADILALLPKCLRGEALT